MEQIDQLLTIAEISFALAGFAGVIATFQFRQQERVTRGQAISLSMIVNISPREPLNKYPPLCGRCWQ